MELNHFVEKFSEQFEETEPSVFKPDTIFKQLDEWSSMTALSVIAMVDSEYAVKIAGNEIKNVSTIKELYELILSKR